MRIGNHLNGAPALLSIEIDLDRITLSQTGYLALGTRQGTHLANRVRMMRDALSHGARRFNDRQAAALGKGQAPLLADGLPATLDEVLFGPLASQGWPRRGAAVLHGLHLPGDALLPAAPCCPGGPDLSDLDPDSYLTRLDDGPTQERSHGDTTALVAYLAPLNQFRILWIGAEADCAASLAKLQDEIAESRQGLSADYAAWLDKACRERLAGA